ncbi:MAG: class I SAM-dependent methyltransferase [Candidatus Sulfotelmatobacter sp.]
MALPDASPVLQLIEDFRRSKTMFAAVSLGIFDALERAASNAATLATQLTVQSEPLERLLDACVGLKLLRRKDGIYENEPVASTYLCRTGEHSLTGYILYSNEVLFSLWNHLEDAIREGKPCWSQVFETEGAIFDHFFRSPEAKQTFLHGMHGLGVLSSPRVIEAVALSQFRQMVDLGGGTGHLAIAACERYPDIRAMVFDLPQVVETAKTYIAQSSAASRIGVIAGDFFNDDLPGADLFAMGRILHDWSDLKINQLLAKIYKRLPAGGALLLAEKLLCEDKTGPVSAQLQSLNMLVCTEGKERSLTEYRQVLETAGFAEVQGFTTGSPVDAILALKP